MKTENAIEVKNVKKSFKIFLDKGHTIKEKIVFKGSNRYENRQVLKDISFEVKKGEAIGLIGHNGCGKSTMLKLLTKIMYPDSGTIEMNGRVSSLIELGAGFHPDMTGKENIYINASIFGLTKKEIDSRLDDIIAFSELEEYIDNPVRTYSSGMYMRLAFAVAINVDADILLIDEILAVGDVSFQSKCFNRLREIKSKGTTIVIVSHALNQIEDLCECSYWIDNGLIRKFGSPREVHRDYMRYMSSYSMKSEKSVNKKSDDNNIQEKKESDKQHDDKNKPINPLELKRSIDDEKIIVINNVTMKNSENEESHFFVTGESAILEFEYEVLSQEHEKVSIELVILRNDGLECYETNTFREGIELLQLEKKGKISCFIDKLNLITGEYWIELALRRPNAFPYDYKERAWRIVMSSLDRERGIAKIDHTWDFKDV